MIWPAGQEQGKEGVTKCCEHVLSPEHERKSFKTSKQTNSIMRFEPVCLQNETGVEKRKMGGGRINL